MGAEQAARDAAVAEGLRVAEALLAELAGRSAELAPRREGDPVQPPSSAPGFEALHEGVVAAVLGRAFTALARARGLEPAGGRLLERAARAEESFTECVAHLATLSRDFEACAALWPIDALGTLFEALTAFEWSADASGVRRRESRARKRHGRWFTPPALTAEVTRRALAGLRSELELLDAAAQVQRIERFKVCDPALGAAAFLLETARQVLALHPEHGAAGEGALAMKVRRAWVAHALTGTDISELAVAAAEATLWLFVGDATLPIAETAPGLGVADGLACEPAGAIDGRDSASIDLVIGNPPWVAYAGRSAQPLPPEQRTRYATRFEAWRGFPTLHGLFIERAAELAPRGTIALVVPSPVADLDGYRNVRRVLSRSHVVCEPLLEFGQDAFEGVVQPCIALVAVPRGVGSEGSAAGWRLEERQRAHGSARSVDAPEVVLRIAGGASLPRETFREMGFQSTSIVTRELFRRTDRASLPESPHWVPLLEGRDVREFHQGPSRLLLLADPSELRRAGARLRPLAQFAAVEFVVRQTASFPIAALHGGLAFRNTLLAGFGGEIGASCLVALLNSQLYRAIHLARQRDARQAAFPQVKIAHLRALPRPPHAREHWARLSELTGRASALGVNAELRRELDRAVFELFGLSAAEQTTVCAFLAERLPRARGPAEPGEPALLAALGEASAPSTDSDTR